MRILHEQFATYFLTFEHYCQAYSYFVDIPGLPARQVREGGEYGGQAELSEFKDGHASAFWLKLVMPDARTAALET